MVDDQDELRDLAALVVRRAGALHETGDLFEPYRVVDGDGMVVLPAAGFLRDLQAAGRSVATQRSYAKLCRARHKWAYADAPVMPRLC
jgi:hypothetical protein